MTNELKCSFCKNICCLKCSQTKLVLSINRDDNTIKENNVIECLPCFHHKYDSTWPSDTTPQTCSCITTPYVTSFSETISSWIYIFNNNNSSNNSENQNEDDQNEDDENEGNKNKWK